MSESSGRSRIRRTEAEWRWILGSFEVSGQTEALFCARQGVGLSASEAFRVGLDNRSSGSHTGRVTNFRCRRCVPIPRLHF